MPASVLARRRKGCDRPLRPARARSVGQLLVGRSRSRIARSHGADAIIALTCALKRRVRAPTSSTVDRSSLLPDNAFMKNLTLRALAELGSQAHRDAIRDKALALGAFTDTQLA